VRPSPTPRAKAVEATAPARVDLAGGTLDIWPLYLFHPGAVTVNVAIDRRVWCRVETAVDGVQLESKDTLEKAAGATVDEVIASGRLALPGYVLKALGIDSGVRVVTHARLPAGAGLGASSALAVAVAAAAVVAFDIGLERNELWRLARDAEAQAFAAPTGIQGYPPAVRGGALCLHLEPGEARVEPLAVDPARVEESLLLVDAGPTPSAISNWEVYRARVDGDARVRESLARIAAVAREVRSALLGGRFDDLIGLLAEEWEARRQLPPGWVTPALDRVAGVIRSAGGAAKLCGAGGRVVAVWAPPGSGRPDRRQAVLAAARDAGIRLFPARVDLRGLDVEACA
jgi:D-glycero-alpha-D-manno-heptose-7-phosphate kinase